MTGVIKDNITRPPSYAIERKIVNGREEFTVYYSVQIDGKNSRVNHEPQAQTLKLQKPKQLEEHSKT